MERFISTLTVYKAENIMSLAIEKGGIQALEEFVLARYFMFIQVYFHKTRRYFDKQLVRALKDILPEGKYPKDVSEFLEWDDNRVLYNMNISASEEVKEFRDRITMTCVYETSVHTASAEGDVVRIIYKSLCNDFEQESLLYDEVDKAAHKLQPSYFAANVTEDDSGKAIIILDSKTLKPKNLMEEYHILNGILKPISIKRIYASKEIAPQVSKRIQELLK